MKAKHPRGEGLRRVTLSIGSLGDTKKNEVNTIFSFSSHLINKLHPAESLNAFSYADLFLPDAINPTNLDTLTTDHLP